MALLIPSIPAGAWSPDNNAQLVAGDGFPTPASHLGRYVLAFDDTAEEACLSPYFELPSFTGTLTVNIYFYMASDATNDIALDVFVEAVTPNADTLDLEAASSWDTANSGTLSLATSTAGDALKLSIDLTNKDSAVAGDMVRLGLRRDTDSANDDATGDLYFSFMSLEDDA